MLETQSLSLRLFRTITFIGYFGLMASLLLGVIVNGPDGIGAKLVLWLMLISGLLLVIVGLFRGGKRSYQWLCFILLIYFIATVQTLFALPDAASAVLRWNASMRMFFIVIGFFAAIYSVRQIQ